MFYVAPNYQNGMNLQGTLSSSTADNSLAGELKGPHHPITCTTQLYLDEDNTIRCEHSTAPPDNPRNQAILDCTIAILIFQEVAKKFGPMN